MVADINYTVEATLDSTVLNHVWIKWCRAAGIDPRMYEKDYSRVSKRSPASKKFEDWLYVEGATVARANKKSYLQFVDAIQATAFRLKYA